MNKIVSFFLLSFMTIKVFCQDYELRSTPFIESEIIFKDSTSVRGFVRLAGSVFSLRFKQKEREKERKIEYKKVDKLIIYPKTKNKRTFQYLNHNYNRFKIFVELILTDVISIYLGSDKNAIDIFYSDFDRETMKEKFSREKHGIFKSSRNQDTLELYNDKKLVIPIKYYYYYNYPYRSYPSYQYYLLKENTSKLMLVEKSKRFLKKSKEYFKDCPLFLSEIEQGKLTLDDLPKFIEHYKEKCLKQN